MSTHTMKAAVVSAPSQFHLVEAPRPEPGEHEVRVQVEGCGICGSNLPPWEGRPWFRYPLAPGELGHEGWGRVEAVGPGVRSVREGERVAMLSYRAYAEYDVAREDAVIRLPKELDAKPFPGEALGCALNVFRRCELNAGDTVAIVGIGFLGAVLTALSANAGARVIAVSRRKFALQIAATMGAEITLRWVNGTRDLSEAVKETTAGKGCDHVLEVTGAQSALDLATELTRERGRLIIAGYHQDGLRQVNMRLWNWRGLDVINAHERAPRVYRAGVEAAVAAVQTGQLDPSPLYTHRFALAQLGDGLNAMKNRPDGFLKGLVTINA